MSSPTRESPDAPGIGRRLSADLMAATIGTMLAYVLLLYLHGTRHPGWIWALVCGGLGGVGTRRLVRPSYTTFPPYLRRPLSLGVITLGTVFATWATLAREPASYWLLRWREAITLPVLGVSIGLGLASLIYTYRRLEREIEAKQRLEDDLQVASRIQQSLLRGRVPNRSWVETHAVNIASRQVGGDYYEILDRGEHGICFAVGDVSGKGVPAALLMSSLQSAFLAAHSIHNDLAEICRLVNRFLVERTTPERYATFFVGHLTQRGHLRYVNAGHNPPLIIGSDVAHRLFGGGRPLGLFTTSEYELQERNMERDEVLLVYTDGVTEATAGHAEEFGEARLEQATRAQHHGSAADISAAVLEALHGHTGPDTEQADDITLLVLRPRELTA
ncbi:MAG TPA: PP2C family protein-serine/threonine phosphatase [Acidobacteriota bacterium]|nr:PP2C family protein-serine/threonine phosphatase [Acidobacteriota bacterium]